MSWGARIRSYRSRSGLTQEALAEAFGVEPRTIRRWEADASRPPDHVRKKLRMSPVMVMQRISLEGLRATVAMSPLNTVLMDDKYDVIDASPTYTGFMIRAHGPDWTKLNYLKQMPGYIAEQLHDTYAAAGGLQNILASGYSSVLNDFVFTDTMRANGKPTVAMRGNGTRIFLGDGQCVFINTSHPISLDQVMFRKPQFTFLDEIMSDE
jgi:transcriptional regulator with XRE-family HTH domain